MRVGTIDSDMLRVIHPCNAKTVVLMEICHFSNCWLEITHETLYPVIVDMPFARCFASAFPIIQRKWVKNEFKDERLSILVTITFNFHLIRNRLWSDACFSLVISTIVYGNIFNVIFLYNYKCYRIRPQIKSKRQHYIIIIMLSLISNNI